MNDYTVNAFQIGCRDPKNWYPVVQRTKITANRWRFGRERAWWNLKARKAAGATEACFAETGTPFHRNIRQWLSEMRNPGPTWLRYINVHTAKPQIHSGALHRSSVKDYVSLTCLQMDPSVSQPCRELFVIKKYWCYWPASYHRMPATPCGLDFRKILYFSLMCGFSEKIIL